MSLYVRTLKYFRPYVFSTLIGVVLSLGTIGMNLLKPWPFKFIVDGVLSSANTSGHVAATQFLGYWLPGASQGGRVLALCIAVVIIQLLFGVFNLGANYVFIRIGLQALLKLRTELYAYLQELSLKFHDRRRSSDSTYRVAYDTQSIQTIYSKGFVNIFSSLLTLIGALVILFRIHWQLTLASLTVFPFVIWAIRAFAARIRMQSTHIQEKESNLLSVAQEGISSVRLVQAFNRQSFEVTQFQEHAVRSLEANLRFNTTTVVSSVVVGALMALGTAILYYVGSLEVLHFHLSLGDLLVFAAYLLLLYQPLEQLTYTAWAMEGAAAGAQRCFEVLDRLDEVPETPNAQVLRRIGPIEFVHVGFRYNDEQPVLEDVCLSLNTGESLAIVGGTGAGKSTLLSLVPRFYDPTEGAVRIGGENIRNLKKESLRSQIGIVLQDTILFSTTIRENIAYGCPNAKPEEIVEAARHAQALEFIERLPSGFDTLVGERGGYLSVGQRQRIGIARAFLKNAPILLLDEPTSALDPRTEANIMETIWKLMQNRTTLIVTHRLGIIHRMSRIVVLQFGRVVEEGTGEALLARGGTYTALYQAGHF
ncbi:MAG: ABC transporter ATP-binding protein [Verrucomicrobia bacterium]|nr:MAG: ABC transporter ATP-binding protein [Verrucomicrobiota bacterium]